MTTALMVAGLGFSELAVILLVDLVWFAFAALMIYFLIVRPLFRRRHHETGQK